MDAARRLAVAQRLPIDARRVLTCDEARQVYDRAGSKVHDSNSVYGGPATTALLAAAELPSCLSIFECGCGPGRLADRLLRRGQLAPGARYVAVDASPVAVELSRKRLEGMSNVSVRLTSGDPSEAGAGEADSSFAAVLSTYVLDILSHFESLDPVNLGSCNFRSRGHHVLEAWHLLQPGGKLCLINLGDGCTPVTHLGSAVWGVVHALAPRVVGGCRSQSLLEYLGPGWVVVLRKLVPGGLVASEVLVATKGKG